MTADEPSRGRPKAFPSDAIGPRAETVASLTEQVGRLARDLAAHRWLAQRGDALALGAALAAAHGALALATAPLCSPAERGLRRAALDGAMPALVRAGLGHIADLVAAALVMERHPVVPTRMRGEPQ